MTIVERLRTDPPRLHTDAAGQPIDYGVAKELLQYIEDSVKPGMRTIETGAGHSTLVFAAQGAEHACVMPDQGLVDRIRGYATDAGIGTDAITFHVAPSEKVLPTLEVRGLEFALIDGRHAFPSAMIDWYYIAARMAVGGILVVDDIQLWSCRVLRDFLREEPEWEVVVDMVPRWTSFRKVADGSHSRKWHEQPYVARKSRALRRWRRVHKWMHRLRGG